MWVADIPGMPSLELCNQALQYTLLYTIYYLDITIMYYDLILYIGKGKWKTRKAGTGTETETETEIRKKIVRSKSIYGQTAN